MDPRKNYRVPGKAYSFKRKQLEIEYSYVGGHRSSNTVDTPTTIGFWNEPEVHQKVAGGEAKRNHRYSSKKNIAPRM